MMTVHLQIISDVYFSAIERLQAVYIGAMFLLHIFNNQRYVYQRHTMKWNVYGVKFDMSIWCLILKSFYQHFMIKTIKSHYDYDVYLYTQYAFCTKYSKIIIVLYLYHIKNKNSMHKFFLTRKDPHVIIINCYDILRSNCNFHQQNTSK